MHICDVCGNVANDLPSDLADVSPLRQEILQDTHTGTYKYTPGYIHITQVHTEILDNGYIVWIQKKYFWDLFTLHLSKLFSNQTMEKLQTKQMLVLKTVYVWKSHPPML